MVETKLTSNDAHFHQFGRAPSECDQLGYEETEDTSEGNGQDIRLWRGKLELEFGSKRGNLHSLPSQGPSKVNSGRRGRETEDG